jgi:hypothetical protein
MTDMDASLSKKTAKLQIENQADSGRRLVEYFVVVSSIERSEDDDNKKGTDVSLSDWKTESATYEDEDLFAEFRFRPSITARYPLVDHPDNPLHENVTFFCHPSGGIQLRTQPFMPKVRH